jgi:phage-related protein
MRKLRLFGGYFEEFMKTLTSDEQKKINYILDMLKWNDRVSSKFVKHLCDGLYEIRMEYNSNIYRLFFIFDEGNIIVLFNGFQKKSQKTPQNELSKALKIKEEYYASKK